MEHPYTLACKLYSEKLSGDQISYSDIYKQVFDVEISNQEAMKRLRFVRDAMAINATSLTTDKFENAVVFNDEYNALRQEKRELARIRRLESVIKDEIKTIKPSHCCITFDQLNKTHNDKTAILQVSDIHYGLEIDNAWNRYNTDICKERLDLLASKTLEYCVSNNVKDLTIVFQGDLISGNIRNIIRLQNQVDLAQQIIGVTKLLIDFVTYLCAYFNTINVYFADGNHERVTPHKDDNLPDENLLSVIKWIIAEWFRGYDVINVVEINQFGNRIATFTAGGLNIAAVHGDYDKFSDLYNNITSMARSNFDIILTAHKHSVHMQDIQNCFLISNGCVCGPDDYSISLRLLSRPAQNLIVINSDKSISLNTVVLT